MKDNGGTAFSEIEFAGSHSEYQDHYLAGGMTLLDYFAGQLLAGQLFNTENNDTELYAKWAYDIAEAMIQEKRRRDAD